MKNENFINQCELKKYGENNFGINIEVDKLNIEHSTICAENEGQVNIKATETRLWKSTICGPEIYLDSDSIVFYGSLFNAKNGIIIEEKEDSCDTEVGFYYTKSSYTIYNGREIITDYEGFNEKEQKRLALINKLTNIVNKYQ